MAVSALLLTAWFSALPITAAAIDTETGGALDVTTYRGRVIDERAVYGLPVDEASIDALIEGGSDVGTEKWGISLTAEEERAVDLPGRMVFADFVNRDLILFAETLPTYGGVWFDQQDGGSLVVHLTELDDTTVRDIESRLPSPNLGIRFSAVKYTLRELEARLPRVSEAWERVEPQRTLSGTGISVKGNGFILNVFPEDEAAAEAALDAVSADVGAPVSISVHYGGDTACTDRDWCGHPLVAGDMIRRGHMDSNWYCTMGFHITIAGDNQFLTSGHCGYGTPNTWYHRDLHQFNSGLVGGELATQEHR